VVSDATWSSLSSLVGTLPWFLGHQCEVSVHTRGTSLLVSSTHQMQSACTESTMALR
jgi:hypothetical protein